MSEVERPAAGESKLAGRLLILAAALMWSTSGFFAKAPIFNDWPVEQRGLLLAFWRAVFAALVLFPMVRRPRFTWRLLPLVLIFAAMNVTYLSAMARTEAAIAIWLQNTAPVWVFLVGALVLKDAVGPRDWLLLLFAMLGVGLIVAFEARGQSAAGLIYGILGGATYAGVVLTLRQMRDQEAAWLVAVAHLGTAVLLAPWALQTGRLPQGQQWLYLAAFGMLQMGIPYMLFARGIRTVPGHEASGIVLLEPILVPVWVYLAWRGHPDYTPPRWWTLVGGGLILTGLVWRYLRIARRPTPPAN